MKNHIYHTFTDAYYGLLDDVFNNPSYVCSPRGQKIKEKIGLQFVIKSPQHRLLFIKERDFSVSYIIAEALWYFSGNDSTQWIANYSKFWEKISDDGVTANSAYGARIFKPHERAGGTDSVSGWNQWEWVIDELEIDNDSRRAIIHIKSPLDSRFAKKDVPCTLTLQFLLRNDHLYLIVSMRSSDLWLGIANDVPAFTFFQEKMAQDLSIRLGRSIKLGSYIHQSNSLHIYERDFEKVDSVLKHRQKSNSKYDIKMPTMSTLDDDLLAELLKTEQIIRSTTSVQSLVDMSHNLRTMASPELEYWIDWIIILAAHQANKLGYPEIQKSLIQKTTWDGYHYFSR